MKLVFFFRLIQECQQKYHWHGGIGEFETYETNLTRCVKISCSLLNSLHYRYGNNNFLCFGSSFDFSWLNSNTSKFLGVNSECYFRRKVYIRIWILIHTLNFQRLEWYSQYNCRQFFGNCIKRMHYFSFIWNQFPV